MRSRLCIFLIWILGCLPIRLRQSLGRNLGKFFCFFPSEAREVAQLQLSWHFGKGEAQKLLPEVFSTFGQTVFEVLHLRPLFDGPQKVQISFSDPLLRDEIAHNPQTRVFLTAHTANWEALALLARETGVSIAAIGTEAHSKVLRPVVEWLRRSSGIQTLWRGRFGARDILRTLQSGTSVAGVIDQDTRVRSLPSAFFGQLAQTPSTLVGIALDNHYPMVAVFVFRKSDSELEIILERIGANSIQSILDEYNQLLEKHIRRYPAQWVWFHKRWRTLEDGTRRKGAEYRQHLSNLLKSEAA